MSAQRIPDSVDVAIIGGGIIGICTALHLIGRGVSVLVVDRGIVGARQSGRNWGWVRVTNRDEAEIPLALDSLRQWETLSRTIGRDVGFSQCGLTHLARSKSDIHGYEDWLRLSEQYGVGSQVLSEADVKKRYPFVKAKAIGGLHTVMDARAEPSLAVPAIADYVRAQGVQIVENEAVLDFVVEAGRLAGLVTASGDIKVGKVVCAAGAWSRELLSRLDITIPQLSVSSTVAMTKPCEALFEDNLGLGGVYLRRRYDGRYTVASGDGQHAIGADSFRFFWKFLPSLRSRSDIAVKLGSDPLQKPLWGRRESSDFEPNVSRRDISRFRQKLNDLIPALAGVEFESVWAGQIDVLPDVVPIIDRHSMLSNLIIATGFSGHGFGIGPAAGKAVAELVMAQKPSFDLKRFRFDRFERGEAIQVGNTV